MDPEHRRSWTARPGGRPIALAGIWLLLAGCSRAPSSGATADAHRAPGAHPSAGATAGAAASPSDTPAACLESGDGYFRAHLQGALEARIDWPNSGTRCAGEPKSAPPGVRLSFERAAGGAPDLLFVFGLTGVRRGSAARASGANVTIILQGSGRIFGTLGDSRCTIDSLTQRPLTAPDSYRVEARGFCTQPARAVRGEGAVLMSTFEFAAPVTYPADVAQN